MNPFGRLRLLPTFKHRVPLLAALIAGSALPMGCALNPTCTPGSCEGGRTCDLDLGICVDPGGSGSGSGTTPGTSSSGSSGTCGIACPNGEVCEGGACVDTTWAQWPMPNSPDAGLPNPAAYSTAATGVVLDQVTGLEWQQPAATGQYTWSDAQSYCATLSLGGPGGWRLPSEIELTSLLDLTQQDVAIDPSAFPATVADLFWSSTAMAGSTSSAWAINFKGGSAGNFATDMALNLRCTR